MNRSKAREIAMKILYEFDLKGDLASLVFNDYIKDYSLDNQLEYVKSVFDNYLMYKDEINELISKHLIKWDIKRLPKLDLSILRVSVIEIKYLKDIPKAVSINEAVNLAKLYGTTDSKSYINAVLANI